MVSIRRGFIVLDTTFFMKEGLNTVLFNFDASDRSSSRATFCVRSAFRTEYVQYILLSGDVLSTTAEWIEIL